MMEERGQSGELQEVDCPYGFLALETCLSRKDGVGGGGCRLGYMGYLEVKTFRGRGDNWSRLIVGSPWLQKMLVYQFFGCFERFSRGL